MKRTIFEADHDAFRDTVRAFCEKEIAPHHEQWEKDSIVPRDVWTKAGELGLLGFMMPEEYGGGGMHDFRFNAILQEEITKVGGSGVGFAIQTDLVSGYLLKYCTDEQKARWFPKFCSGEMITAIAMTEPGTGSDLQGIQTSAVKDGDEYVINGSKTFITNGINADFVIVVAKTDPEAGAMGFSLIVVERGAEGFERGRNLDKMGLKAQDTAELFFDNCRVPDVQPARRGGPGLHLPDGQPAPGAHDDLGRRCRGLPPDDRHDGRLREGAQGVRQADRLVPEQPLRAGRARDRAADRAGASSIGRSPSSTPAR